MSDSRAPRNRGRGRPKQPRAHGADTTYHNHKCRCPYCLIANRETRNPTIGEESQAECEWRLSIEVGYLLTELAAEDPDRFERLRASAEGKFQFEVLYGGLHDIAGEAHRKAVAAHVERQRIELRARRVE